jgi:hypothetical protein
MKQGTRAVVRRSLLAFVLVVGLGSCNPYLAATTAVKETYGTATDERSLTTQAADTELVLAGVVPPGSSAGAR